jgi:hypothetical protein
MLILGKLKSCLIHSFLRVSAYRMKSGREVLPVGLW